MSARDLGPRCLVEPRTLLCHASKALSASGTKAPESTRKPIECDSRAHRRRVAVVERGLPDDVVGRGQSFLCVGLEVPDEGACVVELGRADPAGAAPVGVDERRQSDELEVPADPLGLPGPAVLGRQHLLDARAALPAARARLGEGLDQQLGLLS